MYEGGVDASSNCGPRSSCDLWTQEAGVDHISTCAIGWHAA